MAGKLKSE